MFIRKTQYSLLSVLIFLLIADVFAINYENFNDVQIARAIWYSEGDEKAKVPYGILSVKTNEPRKICLNTIRNHRIRHAKHSCGLDFISCLGNRYCPPQVDKQGNKNWIKNVKFFLNEIN